MWKARISDIHDVGNGTADVRVEFFDDSSQDVPIVKSYNFHACEDLLATAQSQIRTDLRNYQSFSELKSQINTLVGIELTLE